MLGAGHELQVASRKGHNCPREITGITGTIGTIGTIETIETTETTIKAIANNLI